MMESISPAPTETSPIDLASSLGQVQHELQQAEGKIMQLELALLQSRDFAIGAAAEASEIPIVRAMYQALYAESARKLGDADAHIKNHLEHIQRLEQLVADLMKLEIANKDLRLQFDRLKTSATWRIGRLVMLPVRVIKRIVK